MSTLLIWDDLRDVFSITWNDHHVNLYNRYVNAVWRTEHMVVSDERMRSGPYY